MQSNYLLIINKFKLTSKNLKNKYIYFIFL